MKDVLLIFLATATFFCNSVLAAPMDTLSCEYTIDGQSFQNQTYPLAIQKLYNEHTASGVVSIQNSDLQVVFDYGFIPARPSDIPGKVDKAEIRMTARLQRVQDGQIEVLALARDDHSQQYAADVDGEVTLWNTSVVSSALNSAHFDPSANNAALARALRSTPGTQIEFSCSGNWQ